MQTTGAVLLAAKRCSLARVPMPAQDSRSAHGLLYLAAVSADWREQEHRQAHFDTDPSFVSYRHGVGYRRSPGNLAPHVTRSIGECRMSLWSPMVVSIYPCGPPRAEGGSAATALADDAAFDRPCVILRDCCAEFPDDAGRARGGARDLLADEAVREEMRLCV